MGASKSHSRAEAVQDRQTEEVQAVQVKEKGINMMQRADPTVRRHAGTAQPNQQHVPTHVSPMCRSKCLIRHRCADVSPAKLEASRA
jgi:hypothetical protein